VVQNSARANNRRDDILKGDPDCWPAGDRDKTASPASPDRTVRSRWLPSKRDRTGS